MTAVFLVSKLTSEGNKLSLPNIDSWKQNMSVEYVMVPNID